MANRSINSLLRLQPLYETALCRFFQVPRCPARTVPAAGQHKPQSPSNSDQLGCPRLFIEANHHRLAISNGRRSKLPAGSHDKGTEFCVGHSVSAGSDHRRFAASNRDKTTGLSGERNGLTCVDWLFSGVRFLASLQTVRLKELLSKSARFSARSHVAPTDGFHSVSLSS